MSARLTLKIFLKDVQRLWWMILLTVLLLGRLVHFDSWRIGRVPDNEEGWLNILLPLAWSFLIALAVFEDPPVGESPFWFTLPCRWRPFLIAKALFVLAFVHVPYLVGCILIVQARGLGGFDSISLLLRHQMTLAAFTIPALALATVVRNVTQYMIVAIVLATMLGTLPSAGRFILGDLVTGDVRYGASLLMTALIGAWISFVQYRERRATSSRAWAIAAVLVALVLLRLPRERFDGLQAAVSAAPTTLAHADISVASTEAASRQGFDLFAGAGSTRISIPISIGPLPQGYSAYFQQSAVQIREQDGRIDNAETRRQEFSRGLPKSVAPVVADLHSDIPGAIPQWQLMMIDAATMRRIGATPVTIEATVLAGWFRNTDPVWIRLNKKASIPGFGTCLAGITGDYPHEELSVRCESPHESSAVHVTVFDPVGIREWKADLNESGIRLDYPSQPWLSPVNRGDGYFNLSDEEHYAKPTGKWYIPRDVLPNVSIEIAPTVPEGYSAIRYEFRNIILNDYVVKQ